MPAFLVALSLGLASASVFGFVGLCGRYLYDFYPPLALAAARRSRRSRVRSYRNLRYDLERDLAPATPVTIVPNDVVVFPGVPIKSMPELGAFALAAPAT